MVKVVLFSILMFMTGCASTETFVAYQGWNSDTAYVQGWYTYEHKIKNGKDITKIEDHIKKSNNFYKAIITCIQKLR